MANVKRIPNLLVGSEAISIEGGLLSPEWLSKIAQLQAMAQSGSDYGIPKGLTLRDEIGRYWRISEALWQEYQAKTAGRTDTRAQTEKFVNDLFKQCLGFDDLKATEPVTVSERIYPIRAAACNNKVPIVISSPQESLDKLSERFGEDHKRRTAFGLLQEYLNASENVLWGIVCDGESLRIVRDNSSLTKPAWISVELKRIFDEQIYADFAVFWLLCHRSRFETPEGSVSDCILEKWKEAGRAVGTRARDQLRIGVEEAIELLGQGFLANTDNNELRLALQSGRLTTQHYFQELLRVVYRLIFLITIEERDLIHPEGTSEQVRNLYLNGYGVKRLREKSIRRTTYDRFSDLWDSLKIVFKGLGQGESRLGLPALGGLFDASQTVVLNTARIDNGFFLQAVLKLYWLKSDSGVVRVNWRDMGPEELGSVYESLLELVPQVSEGGQRFSFLRGEDARGNSRKLTGSYYTPDDLVQTLLDSALEPVVANTIKNNPQDPVKALLNLTIIDPACGSAHFLLAAARRLAVHVARLEADGTPTSKEYRSALRRVIGHCIYGVDRNPMALELARMSLWLEAMTPEAPLNFLDHHMVCGDALIGLLNLEVLNDGIPNEAFAAQSGDDKEVCKELLSENRRKLRDIARARELNSEEPQLFDLNRFNLVPILQAIEEMPDRTPQDVAMKQIALENYLSASSNAGVTVAADMYMTAFFSPKNATTKNLIPTTDDILRAVRGTMPRVEVISFIRDIKKRENVFHWKLKFAHVFSRGGFDVVLGNPPWEKINFKDEEYFASRFPEIANAPNKARRKELLEQLATDNPFAFADYETAKRSHDATSDFCRFGRRYPLTGVSRINLYSVFCETGVSILSPKGRIGLVLASGIATDDNNKQLLDALIGNKRLIHTWDFENREGIFPDVDSRFKFCLFVAGGTESQNELADFAFYLTNIHQLRDEDRHFTLTAQELALLNPNTKTCPTFRNRREAEITKYIYRRNPPWERHEKTTTWPGKPKTPFNMSNDSGLFVELSQKNSPEYQDHDLVPLYESKFIHQYNHRFATFSEENQDGARQFTLNELRDPNKFVESRYWIPRSNLTERFPGRWSFAFRDITQATNERTAISTILPQVGCGNTLSLVQDLGLRESAFLVAVVNSMIFDFCTRQKVSGTHLNHWIWHQLPFPNLSLIHGRCAWDSGVETNLEWIVPRVCRLLFCSNDLEPYINEVCPGLEVEIWDDSWRQQVRCEIDAALFHLYLPADSQGNWRNSIESDDEDQSVLRENYRNPRAAIEYVLDSFPITKTKETAQFGEFRTSRLILQAYDEMLIAIQTGNPYRGHLERNQP